jgi:hypothetical protein
MYLCGALVVCRRAQSPSFDKLRMRIELAIELHPHPEPVEGWQSCAEMRYSPVGTFGVGTLILTLGC